MTKVHVQPKEALAKFKPVSLSFDSNKLTPDVKEAIPHIKKAMDVINRIYLKQQDETLPDLYAKTMKSQDASLKEFFQFFNGPWCTLENYASAVPNVENRKPGCAFYPENFSKNDFDTYISNLSKDDQEAFKDSYTVIRKTKNPKTPYEAIPYHKYFEADLKEIASHLKKAENIVKNQTLKTFLKDRADSLLTGNYRDTDSSWVKMKDSPLELVMGPFEVYDDGLLGIKASYESMLLVVDKEKGDALKKIEQNINLFAKAFPVPFESKTAFGGLAPITVVHEIYTTGEASAGIMASAFNLPNDPWVRKNVGWKQVMIYNIMQAKFENCTRRIAEKLVEGSDHVKFESYFHTVLLHEVSHGLGPAYRKNGEEVGKSLGAHYTKIEEAKADIGALYLLLKFGGQHGLPHFEHNVLLNSFLAGLFRSIRFGLHEAHGAANLIQFNWFLEKGLISQKRDGRFSSDSTNLVKVVDALLIKLCELEAKATPDETKIFLDRYAMPTPIIENAIGSLSDIPVDIRVTWPKI